MGAGQQVQLGIIDAKPQPGNRPPVRLAQPGHPQRIARLRTMRRDLADAARVHHPARLRNQPAVGNLDANLATARQAGGRLAIMVKLASGFQLAAARTGFVLDRDSVPLALSCHARSLPLPNEFRLADPPRVPSQPGFRSLQRPGSAGRFAKLGRFCASTLRSRDFRPPLLSRFGRNGPVPARLRQLPRRRNGELYQAEMRNRCGSPRIPRPACLPAVARLQDGPCGQPDKCP